MRSHSAFACNDYCGVGDFEFDIRTRRSSTGMEAVGMWLILARDGMRVECKTGGGMVYLIIGIIGVLWVSGNLLAGAEELVPFEFKGRTGPANLSQGSTRCSFEGMKLPENVRVYAAGNYSGRKLNVQIDQSGH
jgi:hypothetical protein